MRLNLGLILFSVLLLVIACGDGTSEPIVEINASSPVEGQVEPASLGDSLRFLFLGHIYERFSKENVPDPRAERIDKRVFDGLWLGGDLTPYSMGTSRELVKLDSALGLSQPSTLWARGNHDWGAHSEQLGRDVLGRKSWEFWTRDGLGVFCYNSSIDSIHCEPKTVQLKDLHEALDQAKSLKALVFLSHHAVWRSHVDKAELALIANAPNGMWSVDCDPHITFDTTIWPRLSELSKKGVQVLCLSGDAGTKKHKLGHWKSREGIDMLISGIYNSFFLHRQIPIPDSVDVDQGIVFTYCKNTGPLTWDFTPIDSLAIDSTGLGLISP